MTMSMNREFKSALERFSFEAAAGQAIRHLCDLGFEAEEIQKRLDYPVGLDRIKREVVAYEQEKRRIKNGEAEAYHYVKEYNAFGKATFRRVKND